MVTVLNFECFLLAFWNLSQELFDRNDITDDEGERSYQNVYLCYNWPRICSTWRNHNPVISSLKSCQLMIGFVTMRWWSGPFLYKTNTLNWIFIVLAPWSNSPRMDMSPASDTLSWFRANQSLLFLLNATCLVEKQQIPIL